MSVLLPLLARHEILEEIRLAEQEIARMFDQRIDSRERHNELLETRVTRLGKLRLQLAEMTPGLPE